MDHVEQLPHHGDLVNDEDVSGARIVPRRCLFQQAVGHAQRRRRHSTNDGLPVRCRRIPVDAVTDAPRARACDKVLSTYVLPAPERR